MEPIHPEKNTGQLAFDFSARTKNLLRKSPILQKRSAWGFIFHADASMLMEDRFAIKANYLWRSYRVSGRYRIKESRSFWNSGESSKEVVGIEFTLIECFVNGRYLPGYVSSKDEIRLKKETQDILTNPLMNQNLALPHDADILA